MKNTNSKEFKSSLKAYLGPIIQDKADDYSVMVAEPFAWIVKTAKEEVPHEFDRKGEQAGVAEWLQGLGLGIAYTYSEIIEVSEQLHDCKLSEKEQEKVCDNWFNFIACKIIQLSRS